MKRILLALALLASGCMNIIEHADECSTETDLRYFGTINCFYTLGAPFRLYKGVGSPDNQIMDAYVTTLYLIPLIDFPLEIVLDTITYPLDLYNYIKETRK